MTVAGIGLGIGLVVVVLLVLGVSVLSGFMFVDENTCRVMERFGRFSSIKHAGLRWRIPLVDRVKRVVSFEMEALPTAVNTKLKDDTFVDVKFVQQYWVKRDDATVKHLVYSLGANYEQRITERVQNEARSVLNKLTLNDLFDHKDEIGQNVEKELKPWLATYGIDLEKTLTENAAPADNVRAEMDARKAAEFKRLNIKEQADADYIKVTRDAQAQAEAKKLEGEGLAGMRKALFDNIKDTVTTMTEAFDNEIPRRVILDQVLELQRLDTQEMIAKNSQTTTLFVPTRANGESEVDAQLQAMVAGLATDRNAENAAASGVVAKGKS